MYDFAVVGGGINGLAIGALLANRGKKVILFERDRELGGRVKVTKRDGFELNYGLHALRFAENSPLVSICNLLGKGVEAAPLGDSYYYSREGRKYIFPTRQRQFLTTKMFSSYEKSKLVPLLKKIGKSNPEEYLEIPLSAWLMERWMKGNLRKYLELAASSVMVNPDMDTISAGEFIYYIKEVLEVGMNIAVPWNGWGEILGFFKGKIEEGGEILTGTEVKRIEIDGGEAKGAVLEDGRFVEAGNVIYAAPIQELFNLADEKYFDGEYVGMCKNLRPTSGVNIDFCLRERISDERGLIYFEEPVVIGIFVSNIAECTAPEGRQLLTAFSPGDFNDAGKRVKEIREKVLSAYPEVEDKTEFEEVLPLKLVDGVEVNIDQHRKKRPGVRCLSVKNLYFVGDSLSSKGLGGDIGYNSVIELYGLLEPSTAP